VRPHVVDRPVVAKNERRKEPESVKSAILLGALAAGAGSLVPQATAREHAAKTARTVVRPDPAAMRRVLAGISHHRDETWRWQRVMHMHRTPYSNSAQVARSLAYRKWVLQLWQQRAHRARQMALNPPHKSQWLCIHGYEGSWSDPNSPYYGGLQMDLEFQATYGGDLLRAKGTADHWTPLEQMWVAERAYRTRGFYPWPNTARYCGLI
jgi:hypothetical protein